MGPGSVWGKQLVPVNTRVSNDGSDRAAECRGCALDDGGATVRAKKMNVLM